MDAKCFINCKQQPKGKMMRLSSLTYLCTLKLLKTYVLIQETQKAQTQRTASYQKQMIWTTRCQECENTYGSEALADDSLETKVLPQKPRQILAALTYRVPAD